MCYSSIMETDSPVQTKRNVRVYLGLGIGVLVAAVIGLIYLYTGPGS